MAEFPLIGAQKPIASLSLDLDNQWSYMKTHGDRGWESFPSYLDVAVPRMLSFLEARHLTITFFIVGQDAALEKNREALKTIAVSGHEIGNHSFHHEPWLQLYSEGEIETELSHAEEAIERATGERPRGFRGPGFTLSAAILRVLARRGYSYDASTWPTFLGPLARAYYFLTSHFTPEEQRRRNALFGHLRDGFRPNRPYQWRTNAGEILEIPVTTMPGLRLPFHVSYVIWLSLFSRAMALAYFRTALRLCRLTGTQLSLLLHPLDFLGGEDVPELAFFPAMSLPAEKKLELVSELLGYLSKEFTVVTLSDHARHATQTPRLPVVEPRFGYAQTRH